MKPEKEPIEDDDLKGDGSIDPMEAAEDDLNPMPAGQDDPKAKKQQKRIKEELDELS